MCQIQDHLNDNTQQNTMSVHPTSALMTKDNLIHKRLSEIARYEGVGKPLGVISNLRAKDRYLYDLCLSQAETHRMDLIKYIESLGFTVESP